MLNISMTMINDQHHSRLLIFFLVVLVGYLTKVSNCCLVAPCEQIFIEKPKNTSVLNGTEAILRCQIKNQKGDITWCRDDSFCTFGRKRNFTDSRLSLMGNEANGEHHLVIANATINDNTQYQCQVTATDYVEAIKSEWAFLTVVVKLGPLSKTDPSMIMLSTGVNFAFECIAENSNPVANFTWYIDGQELSVGGDIIEISKRSIGVTQKLHKTAGKLVVKLSNHDWHSKTLKCEAFAQSGSIKTASISDSKKLIVNYAPIVKIVRKSPHDLVDGTFAQFECTTNARPPVTNYRWYFTHKELSNGPREQYLNLKIDLSMRKYILKCDAKNDIGVSTSSYSLDLTYGPRFVKELPSHELVKLNDKLTLHCEIDSNPAASVLWLLNDTVIYAYPNITIDSMRPENYGTYTCKASLKDFPPISSSVKILPPGPPVLDVLDQEQKAFYNSMGTIECLIDIEPRADIIEWYKNGVKVDFSDRKYGRSTGDGNLFKRKEILLINDVVSEDTGNYTCKATNSHGTNSRTVQFVAQVNSMISFLSITILIVFITLMSGCLCIYVYLRYHGKKKIKKKMLAKLIRDHKRLKANKSLLNGSFGLYGSGDTLNMDVGGGSAVAIGAQNFYMRNLKNYGHNQNRLAKKFLNNNHNHHHHRKRQFAYAPFNSRNFSYFNYSYPQATSQSTRAALIDEPHLHHQFLNTSFISQTSDLNDPAATNYFDILNDENPTATTIKTTDNYRPFNEPPLFSGSSNYFDYSLPYSNQNNNIETAASPHLNSEPYYYDPYPAVVENQYMETTSLSSSMNNNHNINNSIQTNSNFDTDV